MFKQIKTISLFFLALFTLAFNASCASNDQKICIVHAVDSDEAALGAFPWPRQTHAVLVDKLNKAGAKSIILKYIFDRESNLESDGKLIEAAIKSKNVILPFAGWFADPAVPFNPGIAKEYIIKDETKNTQFLSFQNWAFPFAELAKSAVGVGSIDADTPDRHLTKVPLIVKVNGKLYPSLALMVVAKIIEKPISDLVARDGEVRVGAYKIKMDARGAFEPRFSKPGSIYKTYSYDDILKGNFQTHDIENSIVIIGYGGSKYPANFITPVSNEHNGSDISADAIRTLLMEVAN